jgi:uncharacterized membrane protein YidH (DUF202 family)
MTRPGFAGPRTELAWNRTILSVLALAVLLLKLGIDHHRPVEVAAASAAVLQAGVFWAAMRQCASHETATTHRAIFIGASATALTTVLVAVGLFS